MKPARLRIIVTGLIAQHPHLGGVTWDYLQYAIGLSRLGHDVFYFEDSGEWPYSLDGGPSGNEWVLRDPAPNLKHLSSVLARYGMGDKWAYHFPLTSRWFGMGNRQRREVIETADLLINVSGTLKRPADYRRIPRLAYIDSDPVFTQIKLELARGCLKFQKRFAAHDVFFTFGDNVPKTNSRRTWLTTRQPIVLSEWNPSAARRETFTTVMSWTSYKPLKFQRRSYGQKDVEFRRFLELPQKVKPAVLEVAVGGGFHMNWQTRNAELPPAIASLLHAEPHLTPAALLDRTGWQVVDPMKACGNLDSYRSYIESSKAEWSVAKNGYVVGRSGWFSCRSACYLAAGRPVIVQDTGFQIPVGEGILAFSSVEQAADAIREVEANYRRHSKAARALAGEYFDSDKVLSRFVRQAMTSPSEAETIVA
jgi:hypothetical protein